MTFDACEMTLRIDDLSSDLVNEGSFALNVTLDDGKGTVEYTIVLDVRPPKSPEAGLEDSAGSAKNSTDTRTDLSKEERERVEALKQI